MFDFLFYFRLDCLLCVLVCQTGLGVVQPTRLAEQLGIVLLNSLV